MTRRADAVAEVLAGAPVRRRHFPEPVEAEVARVAVDGALYVAVDGQPDLAYGPAAWPGPGAGPPPAPGTRCLVVFAGAGADRPWVVAFDGWAPT